MSDEIKLTPLENAELVLRKQPHAHGKAVQAAYAAMNAANGQYNCLDPNGPARELPNLTAELQGFSAKMKGLPAPEAYLVALEAQAHFELRLEQAKAMAAADAKARFDRNLQQRVDENRIQIAREWREKSGVAFKAMLADMSDSIAAAHEGINKSVSEEDLKAVRDTFAAKLKGSLADISNLNKK